MINDIYYQILGKNDLLSIQNELKKQLNIKTSDTLPNLKNENASMMFFDDSEDGDSTNGDGSNSEGYTDYSSYSENTYDQYQDPNTYYQQTEDTSQYYTPSQDMILTLDRNKMVMVMTRIMGMEQQVGTRKK